MEGDLSDDAAQLLELIPMAGTGISNITLQGLLSWNTDRYFAGRDALVDAGLVIRGTG